MKQNIHVACQSCSLSRDGIIDLPGDLTCRATHLNACNHFGLQQVAASLWYRNYDRVLFWTQLQNSVLLYDT